MIGGEEKPEEQNRSDKTTVKQRHLGPDSERDLMVRESRKREREEEAIRTCTGALNIEEGTCSNWNADCLLVPLPPCC